MNFEKFMWVLFYIIFLFSKTKIGINHLFGVFLIKKTHQPIMKLRYSFRRAERVLPVVHQDLGFPDKLLYEATGGLLIVDHSAVLRCPFPVLVIMSYR